MRHWLLYILLFVTCSVCMAQELDTCGNAVPKDTIVATEVQSVVLEPSNEAGENIDVKEIILGHLQDSYWWHIGKVGGKELIVFYPMILRSRERGWFLFSSKHIHEEGTYQGFYLGKEGLKEGRVVERLSNGDEVRPLDISITKGACALFVTSLIIILLVVGLARWYKRNGDRAPRGFVSMAEGFIMSVRDDLIKPCVGPKYERYSPYLLTAFFFIFINNIIGLIPIFPFGANLTGNIAVTLVLALATFLAINLFGNKEYWKEIFWPNVPIFLKVPPIMPLIELFGVFTKPFALTVRLFANIFAGHSIILALTSLIFITASMGSILNGSMMFVSVLFSVFMLCLELLVAYIQAYVFTMLSAVFIGLSVQEEKVEVKNNK